MHAIDKLDRWTDAHDRGYPVDVVRVLFGVFLLLKGIQFARDPALATELIWPSSEFAAPMLVGHIVIMAHLGGGLLLAFGLLTRIVAGIFVPILLVAVAAEVFGSAGVQSLGVLVASLALCLGFLILGPGKGSADHAL